ncbi:MAG TPA: hypothetical protein DCR95_07240 [Desulfobacter sp.]|nr:hypothetical protein [Desulfobacter sp.]
MNIYVCSPYSSPDPAVREEAWVNISNFDGYEVSNRGRVRSWRRQSSSAAPAQLCRLKY